MKMESKLKQEWREWYLNECNIEGTNPPPITDRKISCLSLFSGIGGIDIACELCNIETVAFCEMDHFGQELIKSRWENAYVVGKERPYNDSVSIPIFEDVTKLKGERDPKTREVTLIYDDKEEIRFKQIEAIIGGFPCQPYSGLGKRLGNKDARALFGECIRLLDTIKPRWFLGENVTGFKSLGLDRLLTNLEYVGYDTWSCAFSAASQNAPTMRYRIFIIGFSQDFRRETYKQENNQSDDEKRNSREDNDESRADEYTRENISEQYNGQDEGEIQQFSDNDRREAENVAEIQDKGSDQELLRSMSVCTGQSETGISGELWAPCDTRVYNGKDFFESQICRVRNGNGSLVSKNYIAQIKAAGNAVNPIQVYPLIRYLKYTDDLLFDSSVRKENLPFKLHEDIVIEAKNIVKNLSEKQRLKLRDTFWIKPIKDDRQKLYSVKEKYQPYEMYAKITCDHKLCKKVVSRTSKIKVQKKNNKYKSVTKIEPMCSTKDKVEMWAETSFHNLFKTSELFTKIVMNDDKAVYSHNKALVDEIFKQIVEQNLIFREDMILMIKMENFDLLNKICKLGKY